MSRTIVSIKNLQFSYHKTPVLAIEELSISSGEVVAIVGKSGCGKSTLLRVLVGELVASGDIHIEDDASITYLSQNDSTFEWLSVYENIAFSLAMQKRPRAEIRDRVEHLAGLVGLQSDLQRFPSELSGGMRQRMLFARTIAASPDLALLDEPFGALDLITRKQVEDGLRELLDAEPGLSVAFVTHDIDNAYSIADRIVVLSGVPTSIVSDIENTERTAPAYSSEVSSIIELLN